MLQEDKTNPKETFYCSGCGSDRIVGVALVPMNTRPDDKGGKGAWVPTVSWEEIDTLRKLVAARFWYYCFECAKAKDLPITDGGVQH